MIVSHIGDQTVDIMGWGTGGGGGWGGGATGGTTGGGDGGWGSGSTSSGTTTTGWGSSGGGGSSSGTKTQNGGWGSSSSSNGGSTMNGTSTTARGGWGGGASSGGWGSGASGGSGGGWGSNSTTSQPGGGGGGWGSQPSTGGQQQQQQQQQRPQQPRTLSERLARLSALEAPMKGTLATLKEDVARQQAPGQHVAKRSAVRRLREQATMLQSMKWVLEVVGAAGRSQTLHTSAAAAAFALHARSGRAGGGGPPGRSGGHGGAGPRGASALALDPTVRQAVTHRLLDHVEERVARLKILAPTGDTGKMGSGSASGSTSSSGSAHGSGAVAAAAVQMAEQHERLAEAEHLLSSVRRVCQDLRADVERDVPKSQHAFAAMDKAYQQQSGHSSSSDAVAIQSHRPHQSATASAVMTSTVLTQAM